MPKAMLSAAGTASDRAAIKHGRLLSGIGKQAGPGSGFRLHYYHKKSQETYESTHVQRNHWKAVLLQLCHAKRYCKKPGEAQSLVQ